MFIRFPKDDSNYSWTRHIKNKMMFYGLSESRIKNVLKNPQRKEEGIASNTVAVMKRNDRGKKKEEIWLMYTSASQKSQTSAERTQKNAETKPSEEKIPRHSALSQRNSAAQPKLRMISAWRYPGVSKIGKAIPIPDDIAEELGKLF